MKKYGMMTALFAGGLLLIGIGGGISFAEYTSFSYGGEKMMGDGQMTVSRIEQERTEGIPFQIVYYNEMDIVEDENLPDDKLVFEFTYNPEYTEPQVKMYVEETDEIPEGTSYNDLADGEEKEENKEKNNRKESFHIWKNSKNGIGMMCRVKDEVLKAVKERKIYDYDTDFVEKITVYMSPEAKSDMV